MEEAWTSPSVVGKAQDNENRPIQFRGKNNELRQTTEVHLPKEVSHILSTQKVGNLDARLAKSAAATAGFAKASADASFDQSVDGLSLGVSGNQVVGWDGRGKGAERKGEEDGDGELELHLG